jgi:hypothetical protein
MTFCIQIRYARCGWPLERTGACAWYRLVVTSHRWLRLAGAVNVVAGTAVRPAHGRG